MRTMASFSHGIMMPLNGLMLALAALQEMDQSKISQKREAA